MNKDKSRFYRGKSYFIVILNASNYRKYKRNVLIYPFLTSNFISGYSESDSVSESVSVSDSVSVLSSDSEVLSSSLISVLSAVDIRFFLLRAASCKAWMQGNSRFCCEGSKLQSSSESLISIVFKKRHRCSVEFSRLSARRWIKQSATSVIQSSGTLGIFRLRRAAISLTVFVMLLLFNAWITLLTSGRLNSSTTS